LKKKRTERRPEICIIHSKETKHSGTHFTYLADVNDPDRRFKFLKDPQDLRLTQPSGSSRRMAEISTNVPEQRMADHGYHKACYSKFTKNRERLEKQEQPGTSTSDSSEPTGRAPRRSSGDIVLFAKNCIFCNNFGRIKRKKYGKSISENTSVFDVGGGKNIQKIAEENDDEELFTRIRGKCLFSVEAQ